MVDLGSVVSALKASEGLPTAGVNSDGDSPLPSNAGRMTVQQQNDSVAQILRDAQTKVAQAGQSDASGLDRALEAKDKAIADLREQNEQLHQANLTKLESIEKVLQQATAKPIAEPQINIPGLSDNIDSLSADEQLKNIKDAFSQLRDGFVNELKTRDQNLKGLLGPLMNEVNQMKQIKDRNMVVEQFPNFDYQKYEGDLMKLRAEVPAMTALEAASIVAAKNDPKMLLPREPSAPVVMQPRPSMDTASGSRMNSQSSQQENPEEMMGLLKSAIVKSHNTGNSTQANRLIEELLKRKVKSMV